MHPGGPPDPEREPARFGLWLENACLAFAINQGQRVTYWREEPLEVDAVFEGSWGDWAIEIKTGGFDLYDLKGLLEFCRRNTKFRPLVHHCAWEGAPSQPTWPAGHQLEAILGRRSTSTLRKHPCFFSFTQPPISEACGCSQVTRAEPRIKEF
jgi:hypothetical protein